MRVSEQLSKAFGEEFERQISTFCVDSGLIPDAESLRSERFLARSVVPHVKKLSSLFNRQEGEQSEGLDPYWKESSNPAHLRLAYFLYFMPSNLFRIASIWSELARLGYCWPNPSAGGRESAFRAIEFGAGPASGACGIAAAEKLAPIGLPASGSWALLEQDKAVLQLGTSWAERFFADSGKPDWGVRPFHRKLGLGGSGLLPRNAPEFNLWVMSYFLNEIWTDPAAAARELTDTWERHLSERGIVIIAEPALREQSRKLLELRRELLLLREKKGLGWLKIVLPCLGHQSCGALANPDDWCHEEVSWWRPSWFRTIDKMAGLDRRTLPFSYLVIVRDERPLHEVLGGFSAKGREPRVHRLVSPSFEIGQDLEFYLCGAEGKRRARYKPPKDATEDTLPGRGDILEDAQLRGDAASTRVERFSRKL